jgi:hypothetical protein
LCDVELLSIQLRLLICSVEKARELGISWWRQTTPEPIPVPAAAATPSRPSTPLPQQSPESGAPEECRQFREFQRFREVMQAIEHGPR